MYGDYKEVLQIWDSLLQRRDVYHPPIRRQIVFALLSREKSWDKMRHLSHERCIQLLQENLDEESNNDRDLHLWLQAVRYADTPPSIEALIERVSYWKANIGSPNATYYLYVLYTLQALEGLKLEREQAIRYMEELRQLTRQRRNRLKSFEWYGRGEGIKRLVINLYWENGIRIETSGKTLIYCFELKALFLVTMGQEAGTIEVKKIPAFLFQHVVKKNLSLAIPLFAALVSY